MEAYFSKVFFHDLRVSPLFRKGAFEGGNGHLALFQFAHLHSRVDEFLFQSLGGRAHQVEALPVLQLQVTGAVTLGQVSDSALERKARFTGVGGGVGDAHDHGDHLLDVAACRSHLRKGTRHLTEAVTRLVRVPHQLVQVAVDVVDAFARRVHDGLHIRGLLDVLIPSAGHLVHRKALHQPFAGVHDLVRDVGQCGHSHHVQRVELHLQGVQCAFHLVEVHVPLGFFDVFEALVHVLELQLFLEPVQSLHALARVLLKLCVVKPHFDHALVYFSAHPLCTSLHALRAISSKIGFMAGLI